MAYLKPMVLVLQEFATLSSSTQTASLVPCIVGPCYSIIDPVTDSVLALAGSLTELGATDMDIPNVYTGAIVDEESISCSCKDVIVSMGAQIASTTAIALNKITFTDSTFPEYVELGDYVRVLEDPGGTDTLLFQNARVIAIDTEAYTIKVNKTTDSVSTDLGVEIGRSVDDVTIASTDITADVEDQTVSIAAQTVDVTVNGSPLSKSITSASVYIGHRALRQDCSAGGTINSASELTGTLGIVASGNPLALGVSIAMANTTTEVKYIGINSVDSAGFNAAISTLQTMDDVYAIVPLTQDGSIIATFKTHAEAMSVPTIGNLRAIIGSTPLPTTSTLAKVTQDGDTTIGASVSLIETSPIRITDPDASFYDDGVIAGDKIQMGTTTEFVYTVSEVLANESLIVSDDVSASFTPGATKYSYSVYRELDRTAQASAVAATSKSFNSRRCVHVWPDVAVIDGESLPGYYTACSIAGMTGGLPSQHGFTRIGVGGISALENTNDYFNQTQLNIIAEGGTMILEQANPSAAPVVRHQLTTDMSAIEFQEFSFVKNFDYVSKLCQDVLDSFIGQYNINRETLGVLETALRAVLESLKLAKLPKIGAPVVNYDVTNVQQLDDIRDRVEMYASVEFPYPLNTVGLHLVSQ